MTKQIDTFFVVDFDRCLGNIEGSFDILKEVVHDLGIVDRQIFKSMREEVESNGLTFSALEQITNHYPSVNLDDIEKLYYERARLEPDNLLEPGAINFINFLRKTNRNFCIMSFGDKRWQTIKISSSGIGNVPTAIVRSTKKSEYIQEWLSPISGKFQIPKKFFADNVAKTSNEVVLIDDKISAFKNLPKEARGYYVSVSSSGYGPKQPDPLPMGVKQVVHIDEIITYESER
ncbi:MAG: hypothetical protein NTV39_03260 [Candidatus Saccharibacteria bacterium]|nr:hypothetical protein [Candidatus Saccharibacteria bacterium]